MKSNRRQKLFVAAMVVVALSFLSLSIWATVVDSRRYAATIARADSTLAARPIGRASFVKTDSSAVKFTGRLSGDGVFPAQSNVLYIFTDCIPDTGDHLYPARVNDSLFVMVWLNPNLVKRSGNFSQ